MNNTTYTKCRVKFDYGSLVKLTMLLGLCAGLLSVPLVLLLSLGQQTFGIFEIIIGAPITGLCGGLIMAVLGYPLFTWLGSRTGGQRYTGSFQMLVDEEQK